MVDFKVIREMGKQLTLIPLNALQSIEYAYVNALKVWRGNMRAYIPEITNEQLDRMVDIAEVIGKNSWFIPPRNVTLTVLDSFLDLAKVGKLLGDIIDTAEGLTED